MYDFYKFQQSGIRELHSSAGQWSPPIMRYRKAGVSMCSESEMDEFNRYRVDGDVVAAMKRALSTGYLKTPA